MALVLLQGGSAQSRVKNRFRKARSYRPESARPGKPIRDGSAAEPARRAQGDIRIVGGFRHANLRIRLRHRAFGGGDIRAAFEKIGGDADRDRRRIGIQRLHRNRKSRCGFACQQSDRMLVLRSQNAEVCVLRLCRFQLSFGLSDRFICSNAGFELDLGEIQSFLIGE